MSIYEESTVETVLRRLTESRVSTGIHEDWYYVDEPRYFQFSLPLYANSNLEQMASGAAFDRNAARAKAVFEALERVALTSWKPAGDAPVEDCDWVRPEIPTLCSGHDKCKVVMASCECLFPRNGKPSVPAQLVGVPYVFQPTESVLREPISTGAACGRTRDDAVLHGCFECIERDQVMTSFYGRTARSRVEIDAAAREDIQWMNREIRRCGLELNLIDIGNLTLPTHTFLALVVDRSGVGPSLTAGAKTGADPGDVARGAIEEAMQGRTWLRDSWNRLDEEARAAQVLSTPHTFLQRGLLWAAPSQLDYLSFYFAAPTAALSSYSVWQPTEGELAALLRQLGQTGFSVYVTDLPHPIASEVGVHCVKVVIPELQPLFIDEAFRILEGPRLPPNCAVTPTHFFL